MEIELTSEQIKVLKNKSKGSCLIKGVAGSGKTTIALYKIMKSFSFRKYLHRRGICSMLCG